MPGLKKYLSIAIAGSRGIPNHYGGFEQLAEHLADGLVKSGHSVTVYNSHKHPYKKNEWNGVKIVHCHDAEAYLGTVGQFVYDLNCIRHAKKMNFDVILFLGYTSSSVWGRWFPERPVIISNMDGLEWKRSKYSKPVQRFLRYAEKLAIKYSDFLIADSKAIQNYLIEKYSIRSQFIPYGAEIFDNEDEAILFPYQLEKRKYFMLMARMEKENNVETILDGFHNCDSDKKLLVVGNTGNRFGKRLVKKYLADKRIQFAGAIYEAHQTHTLKSFCLLYFHGHSVGGTNPSLLEAMASKALIAAHDNEFNRAVLGAAGFYFDSSLAVQQLVETVDHGEKEKDMIRINLEKIRDQYNWPAVINAYETFITSCYKEPNK